MRPQTHIDTMIAQARRKLNEVKELQFFGGDALNLKQYSANFDIPSGSNPRLYQIIMTPTNPGFTMPLDVRYNIRDETTFLYPFIERVQRTDGKFEVLVMFDQNWYDTTQRTQVKIIYSGAATFELNRLA